MKIVYLHGLRSSPHSYKCQVLRDSGHEVVAPELPADDWIQSIINARNAIAGSTTIIHSPDDEVVKFEDSIELAHAFGAMLIEAGADHRMNDNEAIRAILEAINENR